MVQPNRCDGWTHPFEQTLHVGDLIIVQGIDPKNIQTAYGTGDIIVFHKPKTSEGASDELIVHRAVANETNPANGLVYFETKGDGNSGPDAFDYDYRGEDYAWHNKISEKLVVGKVLLRVPWVGHVALFMHNNVSGMFVIVLLLIVLIVIEFVIPEVTRKKPEAGKTEEAAKTFEDKPL
jgi:signal peptidase I